MEFKDIKEMHITAFDEVMKEKLVSTPERKCVGRPE
jgi:hypothetical protein